jgi:hypothetical protein
MEDIMYPFIIKLISFSTSISKKEKKQNAKEFAA